MVLSHVSPLLKLSQLQTPLGLMIALADDQSLYFLQFADQQDVRARIERQAHRVKSEIEQGSNHILLSIEQELQQYFNGTLLKFKTPYVGLGSCFQKEVWHALCHIPYGHTHSYAQVAHCVGRPTACRAVARANATNQLAIVIPCHRVINKNGAYGGYAGGIDRKQWLLRHENQLYAL